MTNEEMRAAGYSSLFSDIYRFLQVHGKPDSSDEFWQQAIDSAGAVAERHRGTPLSHFAERLILSTMDEVERLYKTSVASKDRA